MLRIFSIPNELEDVEEAATEANTQYKDGNFDRAQVCALISIAKSLNIITYLLAEGEGTLLVKADVHIDD